MKDRQWRFIRPTHPASTSSADIFSTLKTQIDDQSQYWSLVETPATGTNCIIITPVTASLADNLYVIVANNITGSAGYRTPDTNASAAARLQVGIAIGASSSFTIANSDNPFTDSPRWWKYWHTAVTTALSQSWFIESPESICIGFRTTAAATNYAFIAGAILESITFASGEQEGNLYGIASSGPSAIATNIWAASNLFLSHNTAASTAHAGVFGRIYDAVVTSSISNLTVKQTGAISAGSYSTANSEVIAGAPILVFDTTDSNIVGQYSGLFQTGDQRHLAYLTNASSADLAYFVGASNTAAVDVVMFAPASGSNIMPGSPF